MRIINTFRLITLVLIVNSCTAQRLTLGLGTLMGTIGIFEGNCMPSPGVAPCHPSPISTTVYITSPSEKFQVELLKDSVVTNEMGKFSINLPVGDYSIFLRDGEGVVCSEMRCNTGCLCSPLEIVQDSTTQIATNLDHASW